MCDYADEYSEFWNQNKRRARTPKKCYACREAIKPGDFYMDTRAKFDGTVSAYVHCCRCSAMIDALHRRGADPVAVQYDLNCGEVWEDPPDEVAALAFALPSDFAKEVS